MYTLYKHTAPNGKVYIGITSRKPESRWECTGGRNAKARKVKNLDTGETFDSISLACAKYAIDHSNIVMACKSQRRKAGGYAWAYVDTGTR
jgi:hypothetical protein